MGIMRMGYAHVRVTDMAEAKNHYANTLGLYEVLEENGRVYYKGWDEWDHHSVVLEEGGVGLVKFGFKVEHEYDIDDIEKKAQTFGCIVERMSKGENPEVSDGIRIHTPSDHLFEVYHGQTLVGTEVGTHNPESFPRHLVGVGVPAIDHALVTAADVRGMERFLTEVFGFYATERVQTSLEPDCDYIGTWMTSGNQIHQLAVIAGSNARLRRRLQRRQHVLNEEPRLVTDHRAGEAVSRAVHTLRRRHDHVLAANAGQLVQFLVEILRRPETDDLHECLTAVGMPQREVGQEQRITHGHRRRLTEQLPLAALCAEALAEIGRQRTLPRGVVSRAPRLGA